jgi:hypothetical protein
MGDRDESHYYHAASKNRSGLHISDDVKDWLENLRSEDVQEINEAIRLKRRIEAGGWLFKWLSITAVSFFAGSVLLGESIGKILAYVQHIAGGK